MLSCESVACGVLSFPLGNAWASIRPEGSLPGEGWGITVPVFSASTPSPKVSELGIDFFLITFLLPASD